MKHTVKAFLLLIALLVCPLTTIHADLIVQPVTSAAVSGVSTVAKGTWLVAKGISGILWGVTKGVYHGGAAVVHGIGTLAHHSTNSSVPSEQPLL